MRKIISCAILLACSMNLFAGNTINTHTNSWKGIPITVDNEKHTFNMDKGFLLPEGEYYYTYSGYRCLTNKLENTGSEPVIYKDASSPENSIYCYPEK